MMSYSEISVLCEQLSKNDKLRLMQALIVQVMREDEVQQPKQQVNRQAEAKNTSPNKENFENVHSEVLERLLKSRPGKVATLRNFIAAMFQFRGGISDHEIETIIKDLQKMKRLQIDSNSKVSYL